MRKKKEKLFYGHDNHKIRSRRDFIAQCSKFLAITSMFPSFSTAFADTIECFSSNTYSKYMPVLIIDLAGGASIAGSNVMVGGPNGQEDLFKSYEPLGLPSDMHPKNGLINNSLGLKFHSNSALLKGILSETTTETRSKCDGAIFCSNTLDDTDENPLNISHWLNKININSQISSLAGTFKGVSGGNSRAPIESIDNKVMPILLKKPLDLLSILEPGQLNTLLGKNNAVKLLEASAKLNNNNYKNSSLFSENNKQSLYCNYKNHPNSLKNINLSEFYIHIDPHASSIFPAIHELNQNATLAQWPYQSHQHYDKFRVIPKLLLDGKVSIGTIQMGGFDYHTSVRSRGEIMDEILGKLIGMTLQLAALKQKNIFIYIITDGSVGVSSVTKIDDSEYGGGKLTWTTDAGFQGSCFSLVYRNDGKINIKNTARQVGHFHEFKIRRGGNYYDTVGNNSSANLISDSTINLGKAVVANYLAMYGEEGRLAEIVGNNPFGTDLEKYLIFDKSFE